MNIVKNKKSKPTKKVLNLFTYKVPNIVIFGKSEIRRKIQYVENNFNVKLIFSESPDFRSLVNKETIAIIVDEIKIIENEKKSLDILLRAYKFLPIFYLSRSKKTSNFYTSLYEKGLQGVIKWPSEAKILDELIIESLRPHPKALGKTKGDEKLSDIIKSHLLLNGNYKSIKVKVIDGFVFLEGSVKSLYDKKMIEHESSKVLGVKKVIVKNIKIRKSKIVTDKEIERKIKMYMSNVLGQKKRSMLVSVKNKEVTIKGAALSHSAVLDIEEFSMKQPGVLKVIRSVKYEPSLVSKNIKKAKSLEEKIKYLFEGVKFVTINIYGEYAEVSGSVKIKEDKLLVERYLLQVLPIKKVLNKMFIANKSKT